MRHRSYSLAAAGHVASVAGFSKFGHVLRASSYLGVGGSTSTTAGAAPEAAGMVAMAGAALPVVAALGALVVAAKLVEVGFNVLEKTSIALVGSIAKIGGARGLEDMFVESVSNDKLANQARFAVAADERLSKPELMNVANELSTDAAAGAFSPAEWLKTMRQIGVETGKQASVSKSTLGFIGQFANVSGTTVEEAGSTFSRIKKQNSSLSDEKITEIMLSGHAIGQSGSFDIAELPGAGKLLQQESKLGGTSVQNMQDLFTIGTLAKQGGMSNLTEVGTGLQSFLTQIRKLSPGSAPSALKTGVQGELLDTEAAMKYIVSTPQSEMHKLLSRTGKSTDIDTTRSGNFINAFQSAVSQRAGVDQTNVSEDANNKRKAVIDDFEKMHMSMEDWLKEVDSSISPQERFKAAFNRIADELEGSFLDVLKSLEPTIKLLADVLVSQKDVIGKYFQDLAGWLSVVVTVLPDVVRFGLGLASALGDLIISIIRLKNSIPGTDKTPTTLEEAKAKVADIDAGIKDAQKRQINGATDAQGTIDELYKERKDAVASVAMFDAREKLANTDPVAAQAAKVEYNAEVADKAKDAADLKRMQNEEDEAWKSAHGTQHSGKDTEHLSVQQKIAKIMADTLAEQIKQTALLQPKPPGPPVVHGTGH